jgi:WD40 repeat protein
LEWETNNRQLEFLLRGNDLIHAEKWLAESGEETTKPAPQQLVYIRASRLNEDHLKDEEDRAQYRLKNLQRARIGLGVVGAIAILLAVVGAITAGAASQQADRAEKTQVFARTQAASANLRADQVGTAVQSANDRLTRIPPTLTAVSDQVSMAQAEGTMIAQERQEVQALLYADLSIQQLQQGFKHNSLLLALEAFKNYPEVFNYQTYASLFWSVSSPLYEVMYLSQPDLVAVAWSADEKNILFDSATESCIVKIATAERVACHAHAEEGPIHASYFIDNDTKVLSLFSNFEAGTGALIVWSGDTGEIETKLSLDAAINFSEWNADGTQLMITDDNKTVYLWDVETKAFSLTLGQLPPNNRLSPDGQWIVSASSEVTGNLIEIRSAVDGAILHRIDTGSVSIYDLIFSPNSRLLAASTSEGSISVYEVSRGEKRFDLTYQNEVFATGILWSGNSNEIISWYGDGSVVRWSADLNLPPTQERWILSYQIPRGISDVFLSPDETALLTLDYNGNALLWAIDDASFFIEIGPPNAILTAEWMQNNHYIGLQLFDGSFMVVDVLLNSVVYSTRLEGYIYQTIWNRDETHLLTLNDGKTIRVWAVDPSPASLILESDVAWINRWSPDDSKLLTVTYEGLAQIWSATTGEVLYSIQITDTFVADALWINNGTQIVVWDSQGYVVLWSATTGQIIGELYLDAVLNSVANPQGTRFMVQYADKIEIYDLTVGQLIQTAPVESTASYWNPDGKRWISLETNLSQQTILKLWDVEAPEPVASFTFENNPPQTFANWSPDGSQGLFYDDTPSIAVYNLDANELQYQQTLEGFFAFAKWNHVGTQIAVGMTEATQINILDSATGEVLHNLPVESFTLIDMLWSNDDRRLYSWLDEIYVWDTTTWELIHLLPHPIGRFGTLALLSPNDDLLLTYGETEGFLWDIATGEAILEFGDYFSIAAASFSHDQSRLCVIVGNGPARIFALDTEELLAIAKSRIIRQFTTNERQRFFLPKLVIESGPNGEAG